MPPTTLEGGEAPLDDDDANWNCALGRWPRELPLSQPLVLAERALLDERVRLHLEADRFVTVPRHCRGPKRACRFVTVPRLGRGPKRALPAAQSLFAEAGCFAAAENVSLHSGGSSAAPVFWTRAALFLTWKQACLRRWRCHQPKDVSSSWREDSYAPKPGRELPTVLVLLHFLLLFLPKLRRNLA